MNNYSIRSIIYCGEKGVGKTTYVTENWPDNIFLNCDNYLSKIKTTSVLENALYQKYHKAYSNISEMVHSLSSAVQENRVVIIDCAEAIDREILKIVINTLIPLESPTIIFTFDIDVKYLYQNEIFRLLIQWDIISPNEVLQNFQSTDQNIENYVLKNLEGISPSMLKELLVISSFNFNNLKNLIWLVKNKQSSLNELNESVLLEYSYVLIEEKFSDIPQDLFEVLKKSSVIGEIFERCVLESLDGFHISGVKRYLEELEAMNLLIHSYLNNETYEFFSNQIHAGVLKCIEPKQRIDWEQILLKYYMDRLKFVDNKKELLEHVIHIKRLSLSLNDENAKYFANKKLLYYYFNIQDYTKALVILDELIHYCKYSMNDTGLLHYLSFYKVRLNIKIGSFSDALQFIQTIIPIFPNSLYLQYYYSLSLYNEGDVDESYIQVCNLISKLEPTSAKSVNDQPIYALSYSLTATLQNHFGIEDHGYKYYTLALNHSLNKLNKKKNIYYEILKKCDMYYSYDFTRSMHIDNISFCENNNYPYEAAEVYLNLATEMMFNSVGAFDEALTYLNNSLKIFKHNPNWRLAYVKNNLAILFIIEKGDFNKALSLLKDALLVGMSSFTYFTIYLNLCMCYLKLYGIENEQFQSAYESFNKYHQQISNRKNATQYDNIYKQITDLIILEHSGDFDKLNSFSNKILAQETPNFFQPILQNIIRRTTTDTDTMYSDNAHFYSKLNQYKIFLAEFRFWE
jgi:hypothetical protein